MRLDQLLHHSYKQFSRTYFQKLIQDGCVSVNGSIAKKSYRPETNDEIEVHFVLTQELEVLPENIPLTILYEDEHMLAINKPVSMVVHPGHGNWSGTFVNALLYYCTSLEKQDTLRPGIVHRLDKDTSGVLIAAKTYQMHQKLSELFATRTIEKRYRAICFGKPNKMTICAPLGRHPVYRQRMAVLANGGKEATTHIEPLQTSEQLTFLDVRLETGRTHQIRAHLQHAGYPLLGDPVYGNIGQNQRYQAERQMLHASSIAFIHPITHQNLLIQAPLPDDMAAIYKKFF